MSNVLVKIKSLYHDFSSGERLIADFVADHLEQFPLKSVYELSDAIGVSVASVSRFVKRIGYDNLKDFKINLARETKDSSKEIFQSIEPGDSSEEMIDKIFYGTIESLRETRKLLRHEDMIKAARAVAKCRRVLFFGIGASGNISELAALRFSHLNISAGASTDNYEMLLQVLRLSKNDIAVGISHSGRTVATVETMRIARENGVATIGISNYKNSPLEKQSDIFFCTSFHENRVNTAALSSTNAQMCLIDALYLLASRFMRKPWDIKRLNNSVEDMLRYKAK